MHEVKEKNATKPDNNTEFILNHIGNLPKVNSPKTGCVFPIDAFPKQLQHIGQAVTESLQFHPEFFYSSVLAAASIAVGNTHEISVKNGWAESALLWMVLVGSAGVNKSHPLSWVMKPISERDSRLYKQYVGALDEYEKAQIAARAKKGDNGADMEQAQRPICQKHIVRDYTPEALMQIHKANERGISIYVDELAGWVKNFNRYNKGSEVETWLSIYSGQPITIDRAIKGTMHLSKPYIPVCGTIQTQLLLELGKDSRDGNGFTHRMLFAMPQDAAKPYFEDRELSEGIESQYRAIIERILDFQQQYDIYDNIAPIPLQMTSEAREAWKTWQRENADKVNEGNGFEGVYSKLEMYSLRLALVLQILHFACGEAYTQSISIEAMQGALKLTEYFRYTAEIAQGLINNSSPLVGLPKNKAALYESLPDEFKTGDAVKLGIKFNMCEKTIKSWLSEKALFKKEAHGKYTKAA